MAETWDYIVVGAGSAGCVLAERLSADGRSRVLVLEAGGENDSFWVTLPKGVAKLVTRPEYMWAYPVGQPRIPGGPLNEVWIRGKGLGGSSAINGMIWSRGEPADYDGWAAAGATGWNGDSMTQAFLALEDHAMGAGPMRGAGGRVHIDPAIFSYPLADRMIAAGAALGMARVADLNAHTGPRVGLFSHNIRRGRRQSAAHTFLAPARRRANVRVITGAQASRILFADGRATAVEVVVAGRPVIFACAGEIVVSAGTMESPLLLQRSGIGHGERLAAVGIAPIAHSPDVGERMIEHLSISLPYRLLRGKGTQASFAGIGLVKAMLRYFACRDGIMATGPFEVGAFCNVAHPDGRTDTQLYLGGYTFQIAADNNPVPLDQIDPRPGITIYGQLLRLTSEGSLQVTGRHVGDPVQVLPNWLTTAHDRVSAIGLLRQMRAYMAAEPLGSMVGDELLPGPGVQSDDELLDSFRRLSTSGLHGIRTCRMGSDAAAVVDPQLRVNGVGGVRVADCSVIPGHVTGNTNAPAMAIGLRAAAMILADRP